MVKGCGLKTTLEVSKIAKKHGVLLVDRFGVLPLIRKRRREEERWRRRASR
jgi:hypothetical protein